MGIWQGAPDITVGLYIWKGIIPAGLGNIIGGAIFCGGYYWFMYLLNEPPVAIDGVEYEPITHHGNNRGLFGGLVGFGNREKKHDNVDVERSTEGPDSYTKNVQVGG